MDISMDTYNVDGYLGGYLFLVSIILWNHMISILLGGYLIECLMGILGIWMGIWMGILDI